MQRSRWKRYRWLAGALGTLCWTGVLAALETPQPPVSSIVPVRLVQDRPPEQPLQPLRPQDPSTTTPVSDLGGRSTEMDAPIGGRGLSAQRAQDASGAGTSSVLGAGGFQQASTDVGNLLSNARGDAGVEVQRRSPIITDPRVRGFHVGQLFTVADHGFYQPARQDIDTLISKFDSGNIRDVIVVKGPYSVRYGPGHAFLDIQTYDAPRYANGFEAHGITSLNYRNNGENIRGRQTFLGGDSNWGFRLGYSINTGNDYRTGREGGDAFNDLRGEKLPSSFNSQNFDFAFGFDLSDRSSLSLKGFQLHQQNVELPGLFFDINDLRTQAYSVLYEVRDQCAFDRFTVSAWYNYTNLQGNSFSPSKSQQIPVLADFDGLGNPLRLYVESGVLSTGYQTAVTWGKANESQITLGTDLRYLSQRMFEIDEGPLFSGLFPIPRSHWLNPGIFMDGVVHLSDFWTVKAGARLDYVSTDIDEFPRQPGEPVAPGEFIPDITDFQVSLRTTDFNKNWFLFAGHLSNEVKVTDSITALAGAGIAQRAPTLTELYALDPFIGTIQNSLNFIRGNPDLKQETLYQFDVGLRLEEERIRASVSGYYAFISDYVTYDVRNRLNVNPAIPNNVGLALELVNTSLATITGFEAYVEVDVLDWLTPFAQAHYVRGTDRNRGDRTANFLGSQIGAGETEPLPGIIPLEGRIGARIHDPCRNPRWSVEGSARLVAQQDRVAASLGEEPTPGFTLFDVRGYWQVNDSLNLSAGIENVFDRFYREHLDFRTGRGVFQPGRTLYVGAELRY